MPHRVLQARSCHIFPSPSRRTQKRHPERVNLVLRKFVKLAKQYKLPFETPKCKEWKNAYKGAGSYYTLMNMVKFHNCKANGMYGLDAVNFIEMFTDQYGEAGEYYKLFAFLKKTIEDNHFDFGLRMKEIYGK